MYSLYNLKTNLAQPEWFPYCTNKIKTYFSSETDRKSTRLNSSHSQIYTLSLHDALPILIYWHLTSWSFKDSLSRGPLKIFHCCIKPCWCFNNTNECTHCTI